MFGAQPLEDIAAEFYHNLAQHMVIKDTSTHDTEFRLADVVGCQTPAFLAIRQLLLGYATIAFVGTWAFR